MAFRRATVLLTCWCCALSAFAQYTAVILHPSDFYQSEALGVNGDAVVGYARAADSAYSRALLWNSSASEYVDLTPVGANEAVVKAASNSHQAGYFAFGPGNVGHAALWSGTAESVVDLNPPAYYYSGLLGATDTS